MAQRSATEIRSSIEANREELAVSIVKLRGEVTHLTDWRGHIAAPRARAEDRRRGRRRPRAHPRPAAPQAQPLGLSPQASSVRGIAPTPISPGPV